MQVEIFKYDDGDHFSDVRTMEIDGEIWFHGSDVATVLGYKRPSDAVRQHCREKGIIKHRMPAGTGFVDYLLINESNVYRLIVSSQLPTARKFEDWLFDEVIPSIRQKGYYGKIDRGEISNFVKRYEGNMHKIGHDYFSVISELFLTLYKEFEKHGYKIPDKGETGQLIYPDISVGKRFAKYLKDTGSEFNGKHKYYEHSFPEEEHRSDVKARMYPLEALPTFRRYVHERWIPEHADAYFRERDPMALEYLPKLLPEKKESMSNFNAALKKAIGNS